MADVSELKIYYPGKILVSDGGALTQYVADSGTNSTIVDAALTQADDFWKGGIIFFSGTTPTVALRGVTAHIVEFDAGSDTLTTAKVLPAAVATGEEYKLIMGGNYRSDTQMLSLLSGGVFPELEPIALTNITGVTLKYVSGGIDVGSLTVDWDFSTSELSLIGGTGSHTVVGDASGVVLFGNVLDGYVLIDIVQASLPGTDQQDVLTISVAGQTFVPDIEGVESRNALKGKTRYRLMVIKNEAVDTMTSLETSNTDPGVSTAIATGESAGTGVDSFVVDDGTNFPTTGFWILNDTLDDLRYVVTRSGDTMNVAAADTWTKFVADANNTVEPFPGDTMTSASGGSGIIDAILLHSGTWAGGDANATFYIKNLSGTFLDTDQLQISAVNIAIQNGGDTVGLRDKTAQSWAATNSIKLAPNIDIAVQAPTANQFSDPGTETEYPDEALAFSDNMDVLTQPISIGNLTAGSIYGIWCREWIINDHKSAVDLEPDIEFSWS